MLTYAAIALAQIPIALWPGIAQVKAFGAAGAHFFVRATLSPHLLLQALIWPFLALRDPLHGAIGLFILFIGLRIAWQLTAATPFRVEGPYATALATPSNV